MDSLAVSQIVGGVTPLHVMKFSGLNAAQKRTARLIFALIASIFESRFDKTTKTSSREYIAMLCKF